MKMAELERLTGVNRETIRYYIREGFLPEPERPKRNVARYNGLHIERLKLIKRLQEESYLPLEVIRTVLSGDISKVPPARIPQLGMALAEIFDSPGAAVPLHVLEARYPETVGHGERIERLGIISIDRSAEAPSLSPRDAQLYSLWGEMVRAGYTREMGYEPETLDVYADAVSQIVAIEVSRFFEKAMIRTEPEQAAKLARNGIDLANAFIAALRIKYILAALAQWQSETAAQR
ncbi:MAG: MerR family transcriptional regulator [Alphaproteobacteria bacterium]|nr:MerR family transcriptional regulator [Alphaproteobacteria bacterium]